MVCETAHDSTVINILIYSDVDVSVYHFCMKLSVRHYA